MTTKSLRVLVLVAATAVSALIATPAEASLTRPQIAARYALAQRGDPYVYGATGPNRWDCSALIQAAYRRAGIYVPRTTYGQIKIGRWVSRRNLRVGDLVFTSYGHVQMYVGNGYIVAAEGTRVVKRKMWGFYTARRVASR